MPAGDPVPPKLDTAYYKGQEVRFRMVPAEGRHAVRIGPWLLGARVSVSSPSDRRLNLYIVVPGSQHRIQGRAAFDHNLVLSSIPKTDEPTEWDIYYAVVLDPSVRQDIRDERELLMLDQEKFYPADLLEFDDLPAARFLHAMFKYDSIADLARFRQKDGSLPRVAIMAAGVAARASAEEPAVEAAK